jgi:hypothetical protein
MKIMDQGKFNGLNGKVKLKNTEKLRRYGIVSRKPVSAFAE